MVASIKEGLVARKILEHLGFPERAPRLDPVRIEQQSFWSTGPPYDGPEPPPPDDFERVASPLGDQRTDYDAAS